MGTNKGSVPETNFVFDQSVYKNFVDSIELFDIKLMNFTYKVKPEYFSAKHEETKENKDILSRSYSHAIENMHHDKPDKFLIGGISWNVTIKKSRTNVLQTKAEYLIIYEDALPVEDEYVEKFFHKVVPFTTYPFFREKVAQFSWASGADLPIMPVLKVK